MISLTKINVLRQKRSTLLVFIELFCANAYSGAPSPFYTRINVISSLGPLLSSLVFSTHALLAMVAMRVLPKIRVNISWALVIESSGGIVLAYGFSESIPFALIAGRAIAGFGLGLLVPELSAGLSEMRLGSALTTFAIMGGVGVGALLSGVLSGYGISGWMIFVLGAAVLAVLPLVSSVVVSDGVTLDNDSFHSLASGRKGKYSPTLQPALSVNVMLCKRTVILLALCKVAAFCANGVLGLFSSLIPGILSAQVGGGAASTGFIVALVMISAGIAQIVVFQLPRGIRFVLIIICGLCAIALFVPVYLISNYWRILVGSIAVGSLCGIIYQWAMEQISQLDMNTGFRIEAFSKVQTSGQLGLILPTVLFALFTGAGS